ncbi:MAG: hypothetical protein IJW19_04795 [Clostridia bacterium]|nr:hypothetical protein [Clostridia bacterium]
MNKKSSVSGIFKGMALGAVVATAVTMAITNKKEVSKKAKQIMNTTTDSISSFMKTT